MPRALLGLILIWGVAAAGCGKEPEEPKPAPAAVHAEPVPVKVETPVPAEVDLIGLDDDAAVIAMMKQKVAGDTREDQDALARFAATSADVLLNKPVQLLPEYLRPADEDPHPEFVEASLQFVAQQIPEDMREAIRAKGSAKVLLAEGCGADVAAALGIPTDPDGNAPTDALDQARFQVAMEREGQKPVPLPADFRDMEGDRESVAALNAALFALYKSGATKEILVVLDLTFDCGAGEVAVKLVSTPPYKSLRIMPEFYFVLCGKRGHDAWSPEKCRWWEDVMQEVNMVSGTYYYAATWPDGAEKRGRFSIDDDVTAALEEQETPTLDISQ